MTSPDYSDRAFERTADLYLDRSIEAAEKEINLGIIRVALGIPLSILGTKLLFDTLGGLPETWDLLSVAKESGLVAIYSLGIYFGVYESINGISTIARGHARLAGATTAKLLRDTQKSKS